MSETQVVNNLTVVEEEEEGIQGQMSKMGDLFAMLAIIPTAKPDWIRETNIDEAEILVHGTWEEDPKVIVIQGPTRGTLTSFLAAKEQKPEIRDPMTVRLMREVILEMPEDLKLRRPFVVDGTVWRKKGDPYPTPEDLFQNRPEGVNEEAAEKAVAKYVLDCLPHRMILQVTAGSVSLGTPDLSKAFMALKDKGEAATDPLSRASAGSSEEAE